MTGTSDRNRGAFRPRGRGDDRRDYGQKRQEYRRDYQKRGSVFALETGTAQNMHEGPVHPAIVDTAGDQPEMPEASDTVTGKVPDRP